MRRQTHSKICLHRPPSGKKTREKIITNYTRQLSSAHAKGFRLGDSDVNGCNFLGASSQRLFLKAEATDLKNQFRHGGSLNDIYDCKQGKHYSIKLRPQSAKAILDGHINREKKILVRCSSARSNQEVCTSFCHQKRSWQMQRADFVDCQSHGNKKRTYYGSESDVSKFKNEIVDIYEQEDGQIDEALDKEGEEAILHQNNYQDFHNQLPFPQTLQPLAHWWTPDIPPDFIGIDHLRCWVFLPSMSKDFEDLPVVPTKVKNARDDLPCSEKMKPSNSSKRQPQEWACRRKRRGQQLLRVPPIQVYTSEGQLLHRTRERRSAEDVRREIKELELLMRGIGTKEGCSLVVQYQYEINKLQDMVKNTLGRVEDIEQRKLEKLKDPYPHDYCGLKKFYKEHDEVIHQVRLQHAKCVRELAILERELKLDSDKTHFSQKEMESGN